MRVATLLSQLLWTKKNLCDVIARGGHENVPQFYLSAGGGGKDNCQILTVSDEYIVKTMTINMTIILLSTSSSSSTSLFHRIKAFTKSDKSIKVVHDLATSPSVKQQFKDKR